MIYIFDDRATRRENNNAIVNKHLSIIKFATFGAEDVSGLCEYIHNTFPDASCILFHSSYVFSNNQIKINVIKNLFMSNGVPFVQFSGACERGTKEQNGLYYVNADVMYNNLELMLDHFEASNNLNLDILLWGEHYQKNILLSRYNHFFREKNYHLKDPNAFVSQDNIDELNRLFIKSLGKDGLIINDFVLPQMESTTWGDLFRLLQTEIDKLASTL